tara:strand:+ start:369 stop:542 length:174 start_codon:yes stop_codon:yes gene_type:complete
MTPMEFKALLKEAILVKAWELILMEGIDDPKYLPSINDLGTRFEVQMPEAMPVLEEE